MFGRKKIKIGRNGNDVGISSPMPVMSYIPDPLYNNNTGIVHHPLTRSGQILPPVPAKYPRGHVVAGDPFDPVISTGSHIYHVID